MNDKDITVFIPTSPVPSHPDTAIIEKVLASVRFHLPDSPIVILADGVRPSVEHRRAQYQEYVQRLSAIIATMKYGNTCMQIYDEPTQQAGMMRRMLASWAGDTPLTMFLEHDTYMVTQWNPMDANGVTTPETCAINWQDIKDVLLSGQVNMVRFYAWENLWHEHLDLMCGEILQGDSRFIKTRQYSQWPNIATTAFYKKILSEHFQPTDKKMIETVMASPVVSNPWEEYKVSIYYPRPSARRFYHMDARMGADGRRDPGEW